MKVHIDLSYDLDLDSKDLNRRPEIKVSFKKSYILEKLPKDSIVSNQYSMVALLMAYLSLADEVFQGKDISKFMSTQVAVQTFMSAYWPEAVKEMEQMLKDQQMVDWATNLLEGLDKEKMPRA